MPNTAAASQISDLSEARLVKTTNDLRQHIRSTEASGDELLENSAELMKALVRARRQHANSPHTGQRALMQLARAQRSIIAAQNDIFRVHDELSAIQTTMVPDFPEATAPSGLDAFDGDVSGATSMSA